MIRAISYGGGVQSTAMLVLAAQRVIDFPLALFSNVGDDSEHPATLTYVHEVAMPYAANHGIELVELHGNQTLMQSLERRERSIHIPVRIGDGAPGNRGCTAEFKIKRIAQELKKRGATRDNPATIALGISLDEYHRMRTSSPIAWQTLAYPLIDLRLDRASCVGIIERSGLPVPPKSSCYFCPFKTLTERRKQRRDEPVLFWKSVELERLLNDRRAMLGKDSVWLTSALRPMDEAVGDAAQLDLFDEDGAACDIGGYCMA